MILLKRIRCYFRGYHYLDCMGGVWCCHECGKPLNPILGEPGPPWSNASPYEGDEV